MDFFIVVTGFVLCCCITALCVRAVMKCFEIFDKYPQRDWPYILVVGSLIITILIGILTAVCGVLVGRIYWSCVVNIFELW